MPQQSNSDPSVRGFQLKMRHSIRNRARTFPISLEPLKEGPRVDSKERILLEAAERGDKHTIVRCLQPPNPVNINCTDIMGRSAIQIAVDNENVEIVEVLLKQDGVKIGDALLYAIREGVYRIVEMLIDHPSIGREMLGSDWATHKRAESEESSDYSPDVSPVILAAYCNQFEILQLLLSRGARIVKPHSLSCCCQRCKRETSEDSLRHSLLRIHTYRALSSPAWISLTSPDPVLTAFKLSRELERLAMCENEFKDLYAELSEQCKKFSCNLLDQCRSSEEVIAVLDKSFDPGTTQEYLEEDGEDGGGSEEDDDDDEEEDMRRKRKEQEELQEDREKTKLTLDRFKLALKYEQKQFVAHPHCQQLLASIWYEGIPGWRRRSFPTKVIVIISLICLLPVMAAIYLLLPRSRIGCLVRTPFMKFMYHSASFGVFLFLLILASTNVGAGDGNLKARQQQRGPPPSTLEWLIGAYVLGFVWAECKQLWEEGLKAYVRQWWNWLDFIMLSLYLCTFSLRLVAYVHSHYPSKYGPNILPRTRWPEADPTLVSEGVFAIANVFSFARIIYLFQANPQLGPLQISLGCMLIDIGKFFFIFFLVITSFACGLNQLYYFYSASGALVAPATTVAPHDVTSNRASTGNWSATTTGQQQTTAQQQQEQLQDNDFENAFDPLDTSFITLFWTLFGLIALAVLQVKLRYIEGFGKVLFGLYNVAARILFLNMLIAMMSKSFNVTVDHADREWKFARSKLWMGYYDDGSTLPPPFNLIVSPKSIFYILCRLKLFLKNCVAQRQSKASKRRRKAAARLAKQKPRKDCSEDSSKNNVERRKYEDVMRRLVSRFIHQWKKQLRQDGVSEDDLLEIKQDISSLRYELREDRKRGEFQSAMHMENLKRDILRFIGTSHHHPPPSSHNNGPSGPGPSGPGPQSVTLSRDSSVDDKIDDMGSYRSSSGPTHLLPDDLSQLRRDIVRSLRAELADVAREMSSHHSNERGGRATSAAASAPLSSQTPPALAIPANSELYHTHLYTQL